VNDKGKQQLKDTIARMASTAIPDNEYDAKEKEEQEYRRKQFRNKILAQIPPRYEKCTIDNYKPSSDQIAQSIKNLRQGVSAVLFGKNGTGKTHIAFGVMKELAEKGISSKYLLAHDLFDMARESFNNPALKENIEELKKVEYLIIDEVDKKFGSQTEFLTLYKVVNYRYNHLLQTMLISNAERDDLIDVIGQSTFDRVAEDGVVMHFTGKNFRRKSS
jgi:DNA replication protein DnaC